MARGAWCVSRCFTDGRKISTLCEILSVLVRARKIHERPFKYAERGRSYVSLAQALVHRGYIHDGGVGPGPARRTVRYARNVRFNEAPWHENSEEINLSTKYRLRLLSERTVQRLPFRISREYSTILRAVRSSWPPMYFTIVFESLAIDTCKQFAEHWKCCTVLCFIHKITRLARGTEIPNLAGE